MTKLLQQAFEALERMPPAQQDAIARALLGMAVDGEPDDIETEHWAAVLEGLEQARRGEFSTLTPAEAVAAAFDRHET